MTVALIQYQGRCLSLELGKNVRRCLLIEHLFSGEIFAQIGVRDQ